MQVGYGGFIMDRMEKGNRVDKLHLSGRLRRCGRSIDPDAVSLDRSCEREQRKKMEGREGSSAATPRMEKR